MIFYIMTLFFIFPNLFLDLYFVLSGLKREEKAAIWAALFGGIVFFVGLGIFVHGFFVRQYSDDYEYMNRIGTLQDEHRRPVAAK